MHQFNESHPAFFGFSKYYRSEIYPQLAAWEGRRLNKKFNATLGMILSSIWCAIALYWAIVTSSDIQAYIAAFSIILSNPLVIYRVFFNDFKADVKDFLVGKVCSFTGLTYSRRAPVYPPMSTFKSYRFFPRTYRLKSFEDHIKGSFQNIPFEVVEAHGETGPSDRPVKHVSSIFKFDLPEFTEGELVVLRKGDPVPTSELNLKRVGFAAPPFSHLFEVYATDQVISRFLLHPVFLERILHAEKMIDGINARFALVDRSLWICVETANRFEQGSMWTSFVKPKRTQFLIWEVSSVLHIVDGLVDLLHKPGRVTRDIRTRITG